MTVIKTVEAHEMPANGQVRDTRATVTVRRCAGRNRHGQQCGSRVVLDDGFCNRHSPTHAVDGKALSARGGRRSGETRRDQAKSIRDRLRDWTEAHAELVTSAFQAGLEAEDERTRVATASALIAEAYGRPSIAIEGGDKPVTFQLVSLLEQARVIEEGEA